MKLNRLLLALIAFVSLSLIGRVSHASIPSKSSYATLSRSNLKPRNAAVRDSNSGEYLRNTDIGFKVFVATSTSLIQLEDEGGNFPTEGIIHMVCVSSGANTEVANVYDSSTTVGVTFLGVSSIGLELLPPVNRSANVALCSGIVDVQFNNGVVVGQTSNSGQTYIYWRPIGGGKVGNQPN